MCSQIELIDFTRSNLCVHRFKQLTSRDQTYVFTDLNNLSELEVKSSIFTKHAH